MFSETNFMEQDSSKNRLTLLKTNRVSKYMLSAQKLCCSYYQYKKARVRNYIIFVIILVMPSKNESIPNIKQNEK